MDVNRDGVTDVLLVAAPMFLGHHHKEAGRVYIYRVGQVMPNRSPLEPIIWKMFFMEFS